LISGSRKKSVQNQAIPRLQFYRKEEEISDNNRKEDNSIFAVGHKALRIGGKFA
jgi:hypothetical protein